TETNIVGQFGDDPYGVAAGDFNEDGHLDVIQSAGGSGDIVFYKGNGDGTLVSLGTNGPWGDLDVNTYGPIDAFEYDGDGHLDKAWAAYGRGRAFFWSGLGDGTFSSNQVTIISGISCTLGISAPPRPPRLDVNISPLDPVTALNDTLTLKAVGAGVN